MIHKFLVFLLVFSLSACQSTGMRSIWFPWKKQGYEQSAKADPQILMRQPVMTGPEVEPAAASEVMPVASKAQEEEKVAFSSVETTDGVYDEPLPSVTVDESGVYEDYSYDSYEMEELNELNEVQAIEQQPQVSPSYTDSYSTYNQPVVGVVRPVRVAILVPLSGTHADLGKTMVRAAEMALFDIGYDFIHLMPRDTQGTSDGARKAAEAALNDGTEIILGPLFGHSVKAAQSVLRSKNIKMIAFSTDWSLASSRTFIMGFLPFAQVVRIAEYAVSQGMRSIGILAPDTDYGNAVIATYEAAAQHYGFNPPKVARYADQQDATEVTRAFTGFGERNVELQDLIQSMESQLEAHPDDEITRQELTQLKRMDTWGKAPFDAILLPVGGDHARAMASLLSYYDLGPDEVKRLGTGLWDDPSLASEGSLEGAWFSAPSPSFRESFEKRYKDIYGNRPVRLATLAYDATALVAILAKRGLDTRGVPAFDHSDLTNPNGFAGLDGIFRFRPDGLVERGLAVLTFSKGQIKVLDPAPQSFQK